MRTIAAIPAVALLAGCALGLLVPECRPLTTASVSCAAAVLALWAWCAQRPMVLVAATCIAFAAGGAALSVSAWQFAWRPPLRVLFDDLARSERAQASLTGRILPEDDEVLATVEGLLRADASPGAAGVTLSVAVTALEKGAVPLFPDAARERGGRPIVQAGGIIVTVAGELAAARVDQWRSGRTVRMPVQLHRPPRYLDPGVPDQERALARRDTTLVGSVKSGALVDVVSRGDAVDEWLAAVRAYARRAIASAVGRWSPRSAGIVAAIVIGDRAGLDPEVQRRLQEAGTYHVIAISGGNIAILAGLLIGFFRLAGVLGRTAMVSAIGVAGCLRGVWSAAARRSIARR